ncbi:MAG: flagellar basal body rod protein FlgB [Deltaproteobacteria bacterium]|nr:flagellar basal body rod protein FlgB [Deltaproteobacteria bacterium]
MIREIFSGVLPVLERSLNIRALRHRIISSNIANEETPGYKARDIEFQQELDKMIDKGAVQMVSTNKNHISSAALNSTPQIVIKGGSGASLDGNTVSLEKEMVNMAENTMMYNASAAMLIKKMHGLREAIKEGR